MCVYNTYIKRSVWKKSNHCYYNGNGLRDFNTTWQPGRVDWCAHAWTMMTSLYYSLGALDSTEWAYGLCDRHIQKEWLEQWICIKFCIKLEYSSAETIWSFRRPQLWATGDWQLHNDNMPGHASRLCSEFFWRSIKSPRWLSPLQPRFGALRLLAFPNTKITFEREGISDHWWDSGKYHGAAVGD